MANINSTKAKIACEYSRLSSLPAGLAFRISPRVLHVVVGASERRLYSQAKAKKALKVSPLTKLLQLTTTCTQRNKYVVNTDLEDSHCPTYF